MQGLMTPSNPIVGVGNILNVVVRDPEGHLSYKHYIVAKQFDYRELLNAIREEGHYKTEEVYERLHEVLVDRRLVFEGEAALLDLGVSGRVSEAVMDSYKDQLNEHGRMVDEVIVALNNSFHEFQGPEGDLHVLKIDTGYTLGYVKLCVSHHNNVERWTTLDITGPESSDFPPEFQSRIEAALMKFVADRFPDDYLALRAYIGRSDMARAEDIIIEDNSCTKSKYSQYKTPPLTAALWH